VAWPDYDPNERRMVWLTLRNDIQRNDRPCERRLALKNNGPNEQRGERPPQGTTPNELSLVLRKSHDSVITFPLTGVAPR
jgi:hypothetical protein